MPRLFLARHADSELRLAPYSSTLFVLRQVFTRVRPEILIHYVETKDVELELCAFEEMMKESRLKFEHVAANKTLTYIIIESNN